MFKCAFLCCKIRECCGDAAFEQGLSKHALAQEAAQLHYGEVPSLVSFFFACPATDTAAGWTDWTVPCLMQQSRECACMLWLQDGCTRAAQGACC